MSKVFAVQDPQRRNRVSNELERIMDISKASTYGEVSVLLEHRQVAFTPGPMIDILSQKLNLYCDDDYIIPIGDPTAIAAAVLCAARANAGRVNLLKWDKESRSYIRVTIDPYYRIRKERMNG